jgi:heat shock protein HtpX
MGRWGLMFGGYGGGNSRNRGGGLGALLAVILAPLGALILQMGISRQREYQADASGVQMVGHANGLISALEKLGAYNQRIPMNIPQSTSALCIVQPLTARELFSSLFSTHPPLSDRIAVLRDMTITR